MSIHTKVTHMKIGKIILLVLGLGIVALGAKAMLGVDDVSAILNSAVMLESPVVLPENEGKMVIICGKPEMIAPAYDEELGVTLNSIKAYRYDQEYRQKERKDNRAVYDWVSRGQKEVLGEAALGEFTLDDVTLRAFPADRDYEDFDPAELSTNGYGLSRGKTAEGAMTDRWHVIVGGPQGEAYYYSTFELDTNAPRNVRELDEQIAKERDGTMAYAYKVYTGSVSEEVTIAGIQRGNTLAAHEELHGVVHQGVVTQEELAKSSAGSLMGGSMAGMAFGLVLVFLALRKPGRKAKAA